MTSKKPDNDAIATQIKVNFDAFRSLCEKLGDRSATAVSIVDHFGDRLAMCPASAKKDYHCAYPGGLVEHSLRVYAYAKKMSRELLKTQVSHESLRLVCLFHDLGKVGDVDKPYYVDQTSDYWRDRGNLYEYNLACLKMTTTHRTLFLLQHFGLRLDSDEWRAILLCDGQYVDENKYYRMKEPRLAVLAHQADMNATLEEKESGRASVIG